MRPNERTCRSCLRRGRSNWRETNPCWEGDRCGGCFGGYVWDRRAPSRRRRGGGPGRANLFYPDDAWHSQIS